MHSQGRTLVHAEISVRLEQGNGLVVCVARRHDEEWEEQRGVPGECASTGLVGQDCLLSTVTERVAGWLSDSPEHTVPESIFLS